MSPERISRIYKQLPTKTRLRISRNINSRKSQTKFRYLKKEITRAITQKITMAYQKPYVKQQNKISLWQALFKSMVWFTINLSEHFPAMT